MKATIEIQDKSIEVFIKNSIDEKLSTMDVDAIIEAKINNKVSEILKRNLSDSKVENFARDRVSRIITLKGLVLRGLYAKYIQPRKTKPMLYEEVF